eukprot:GGOE01014746.1.p1 GENE.GGOE01014746.1~~GGOE01014746.1.p1  ORF type:complete len:898 (-),score=315.12 GGOE01014746.1:106-2799(-)
MDFIDEEAREHFRYLQQSIGQNFASVLNNPRENEAKSWGDWSDSLFGKNAPEVAPPLCNFPPITVDAFVAYCSKVEQLLATFNAYHKNLPAYKEEVQQQHIGSLPGIPLEFFLDDYDFFNSQSFGELAKANSSAANPPMDEKVLHDYLETVEISLFKQVRARSDQFFRALAAFHNLRKGVADACGAITSLRDGMASMDQSCVRQAMEVVQLHQRKANMGKVLELMETVQSVRQVQSQVRVLLSAGEYITALDMIDSTIDTLKADLVSITSLKHLQQQLQGVRTSTGQVMQSEFLSFILADNNMGPKAFAGVESTARLQLTPLVYGLVRSNLLQATLQAFKNSLIEKAKLTVNDAITNSLDLLSNQPGFPTAAQVQAVDADPTGKKKKTQSTAIKQIMLLELDHFLFLINQVFDSAHILLQTTCLCCEMLLSLVTEATEMLINPPGTSAAASGSSMSTSFGSQLLLETLRDTRVNVIGIVHSRIMRLFDVRAAKHDTLRFDDFAQLLKVAFVFVNKCDSLFNTGNAITTLHSTLISQTKSFFLRQHERHMQKLGSILAQEQWKHEKDVEPSFQKIVEELTSIAPEAVSKALERRADQRQDAIWKHTIESAMSDLGSSPQFLQPPDATRPTLLCVANRGYPVGTSIFLLVQLLADYDKFLMTFPFVAVDILQRLHDLLKTYDTQTSRLVLGAAAIETAGLKTITTFHLALAVQCLSFVLTLVPYLRARYLPLLPTRHATFVSTMLDRYWKEVTTHRNEFYTKIVNIMRDRLTSSPELAVDPSKWADVGSGHIRLLIAEIGKLWKVLKQYFHLDQTQHVFSETVQHYNRHLRQMFRGMALDDPALWEKVVADVKNYKVNIERFGIRVLLPDIPEDNTEEAVLAFFLSSKDTGPMSPSQAT